jgi:hypothetical protein
MAYTSVRRSLCTKRRGGPAWRVAALGDAEAPVGGEVCCWSYSEDAEVLARRFVDWYCDDARRYFDRRMPRGHRSSDAPRVAAIASGP